MPKPLSVDLRERIVLRWQRGGISVEELADVFMVSEASVRRLLDLKATTGSVQPRPHGGGRQARLDETGKQWLRQFVERYPDRTTFEFTEAYNEWSKDPVHRSIILRALREMGFTRKKSRYWPKNAKPSESKSRDGSTSKRLKKSPVRVLFSWTRPARTSH